MFRAVGNQKTQLLAPASLSTSFFGQQQWSQSGRTVAVFGLPCGSMPAATLTTFEIPVKSFGIWQKFCLNSLKRLCAMIMSRTHELSGFYIENRRMFLCHCRSDDWEHVIASPIPQQSGSFGVKYCFDFTISPFSLHGTNRCALFVLLKSRKNSTHVAVYTANGKINQSRFQLNTKVQYSRTKS